MIIIIIVLVVTVIMIMTLVIIMDPNDRFEEQSHEIKEAQEKLSEIVLAKQVQLHDDDNDGDDVNDDNDGVDDGNDTFCGQAKKGVDMERLALGPGG